MACFCIHSQMPNSIDWDRQRDRIQCRQIRGHGDCKSQSNDSVVWHGRWAARRQCLSREVGCPIASCMWVREGWEAILPYLPTTNEARELSDMTVWAARCSARGSNIAITMLTGVLEPALELLDQLSPLGMEHRLRRNAGECCWIGNTDMLRSSADTLPTGYISSCIDVTDSKRARKKLCLLGHLITTEEDQRGAWVVNSRRISVNALLFWLSNCKIVPAIHRLGETR